MSTNPGDRATSAAEARVEKRIKAIYAQAQKDLQKKLEDFEKRFAAKDAEKQRKVAAGELTKAEYDEWRRRQVFTGDIWRQKVEQATKTLLDANRQAMQVIDGEKMGVFAENANWQAYKLSHDANLNLRFDLYDKDAVGKLIREQPELMPRKVVDGKRDRAWNQKKIANVVSQGIIQGESLPEITARMARQTAHENDAAMARYAATAMTAAQNAGRMETLERAKGMGIKCRKKWLATLDKRTRDSHQELDGQVVDVDKPFITHNRDGTLSEIMFPGDPSCPDGEQVWNCRCTLVYVYDEYPDEESERISAEEYEDDNGKLRTKPAYVKNMTYREWQKMKAGEQQPDTESELEQKLRRPRVIQEYQPDQHDEEYKHKDEMIRAALDPLRAERAELFKQYQQLPRGPERSAIIQRMNEISDKEVEAKLRIERQFGMEETVDALRNRSTPWVPVQTLEKPLSEDDIIRKLCGGDQTQGSCASLGFAYVGQKAGLDITDFRGGDSQYVFSHKCVRMLESFKENGLDVKVGTAKSYVTAGKRALEQVEQGKQYYFECGRHAAIVRRNGDQLEYLELQSSRQNGWMPFSRYGGVEQTLNRRFGAPKSGRVYEVKSYMVDVDELAQNERFKKCLGYINTDPAMQKKGAAGHER